MGVQNDMRAKRIFNPLEDVDYAPHINREVNEFFERYKNDRDVIASGILDAPYLPRSILLGNEKTREEFVYKQMVPGYFYRQRVATNVKNADSAAVLTASDPNKLIDDGSSNRSARFLYMVATPQNVVNSINDRSYTYWSDGTVLQPWRDKSNFIEALNYARKIGVDVDVSFDLQERNSWTSQEEWNRTKLTITEHMRPGGNNMFYLPCGENTYITFLNGFNEDFEYVFVPTVEAATFNIRDDNFLIKVGKRTIAQTGYSSYGGLSVDSISSIYSGDWRSSNRFTLMFGQRWANLDAITFVSYPDYKSMIMAERSEYLHSRAGVTGVSVGYYRGY